MSKAPRKPAEEKAGSPLQALLGELLERVVASAGETTKKRGALPAVPMLEPASTDAFAAAQGDHRLKLPSLAYALSLLPGGHWSAFAPESPLRAHALITLGDDPVPSARALLLPERVLNHLLGLDALDDALKAYASEPATAGSLSPSHEAVAEDLAGRLGDKEGAFPLIAILGSERRSAFRLAAAALEKAGCRPLWIEAEALPASPAERLEIARRLSREYGLARRVPVLDAHDISAPNERRALMRFAAAIRAPVLLLSAEPPPVTLRAVENISVPHWTSTEQASLWKGSLGPLAREQEAAAQKLAAHFTLPPDLIEEIAKAGLRRDKAERKAKREKEKRQKVIADYLWSETRARTRPQLDELVERVEPRAGWDDIILPARQRETLRTIAAQVSHRSFVHEQWGFGGESARGLGISALFAGPSGTGKSLAAEVIGAAVGLEVYRVDLSGIVSKWVGETERNLKRVFDAAEATSSIIIFEEADALFGKRSEVRESHDRFANIEVSYLLQRMENYRGLAILTTNMRSHLDPAFLRRLRFIVDFPFPGEAERRAIWRLAFPEKALCEGLDHARLAQLNLAGGNIRNVALNAAFLAAEAGMPIGMIHVRNAARAEYEKIGKALTDAETRGWVVEAAHG